MAKIILTLTHTKTVAHILLNSEKGNVLDQIMMRELQETLNTFKLVPELKLIVFEGAGKHFSFGASVEEHTKAKAPDMLKSFHRLFYTLRDLSIPTLAMVSGQCLGGGMELALMCNVILADTSAKFGQPEIILGVFPPPASVILSEKIGLAQAEELLITGRTIDAAEAAKMGLITKVFEDKISLSKGVEDWIATNIIPKSASSLRFAVRSSRMKFNHILSNFLPQLEELYVKQLMETKDANEGIDAFIDKRIPKWENC